MTKLDDAYAQLKLLADACGVTGFDHLPVVSRANAQVFAADVRTVLAAIDDAEAEREILHDLVMDESERRAIGGGPNWRERHEKTWARAMELFEP